MLSKAAIKYLEVITEIKLSFRKHLESTYPKAASAIMHLLVLVGVVQSILLDS